MHITDRKIWGRRTLFPENVLENMNIISRKQEVERFQGRGIHERISLRGIRWVPRQLTQRTQCDGRSEGKSVEYYRVEPKASSALYANVAQTFTNNNSKCNLQGWEEELNASKIINCWDADVCHVGGGCEGEEVKSARPPSGKNKSRAVAATTAATKIQPLFTRTVRYKSLHGRKMRTFNQRRGRGWI